MCAKWYADKPQSPSASNKGQLEEEVERLRRENDELRKKQHSSLYLKVSQKGAASLYGLRRFPVTLYKEEWLRILEMSDEIRSFLRAHDSDLKGRV